MTERDLPVCKRCGKQITATLNGVPWCTTQTCIDALIEAMKQRARRPPVVRY